MKIQGRVAAGKFQPDSPAAWPIALREFADKRVTVEIEVLRETRSNQANRRFWGLLVPLAGDLLSRTRDVPLSKEQVKYVLCSAFLGCDETPLGLVPMRTSQLDTKQFHTFCEKVEKWLNENGYPTQGDAEAMSEAMA